jgi:hypothetical protein
MAGKIQGDNSGNILVEYDYDNIILVDPNKTIKDGKVSERLVDHENLVMYANLEAELLPRTKLAIGSSPDNIRTVAIAKINFLKPGSKDFLNTGYYDELTGKDTTQGKGTNQQKREYIPPMNGEKAYYKMGSMVGGEDGSIDNGLLGITNINIRISASFIPSVTIDLEDAQGRALFQLGEDSPYAAFFHLPYPPFYLTLKGYYGQAIRYQLNLEKFSADFNSFSGNYRIKLEFKGYKFNILNEINMGHLLAVPHMYSTRFDISNSNTGEQPSNTLQTSATQQGANVPNASNSTNTVVEQMYVERGYQKIIEVYSEYKAIGLIDANFPELTVQQLMNKLDMFEKNIIDNYEPKVNVVGLTNIRNYQKKLTALFDSVIGASPSWFSKNLNPKPFILKETGQKIYAFKNDYDITKKPLAKTELAGIIKEYNDVLNSNPTLGEDGTTPIKNNISITTITATTTKDDIDWIKTTTEQTGIISPTVIQVEQVINQYDKLFNAGLFSKIAAQVSDAFVGPKEPGQTFTTKGNKKTNDDVFDDVFFIFDGKGKFKDTIQEMSAEAGKKLSDLEQLISTDLAKKIEDPATGLGFTPTVRNIIAIIMASTEAFIRLMDDCHTKAWDVKYDPVRKNAILTNEIGSDTKNMVQSTFVNQSNDSNSQIPVYPWPQVFEEQNADDKKGKYQLKYPGDPSIIDKTKGYLYDKWPEVEFVEEYMKGLTQKFTPPNTPAPSAIEQFTNILNINSIQFPQTDLTYANKEEIKFFYEIWERQFLTSRYENLIRLNSGNAEYNNLLNLLVDVEYKNILNSLGKSNPSLNFNLKNFKFTSANYIDFFKQVSPAGASGTYVNFTKDKFITSYIQNITDNSFSLSSVLDMGKTPTTNFDDKKLNDIVKTTQTNQPNITDLYPFTVSAWCDTNLVDRNVSTGDLVFNTTKSLSVYKQRNIISNFTELTDFTKNRPVTNFSFDKVSNPLTPSQFYSSTNQTVFLPTLYNNRVPKNFLPTEGYCNFSTPANQLPIRTTTSILNTPYFINSILDGVSKWNNGQKTETYATAAYLFINSLPLTSLREKYKTNGTGLNQLDYIFATLKKFGGIHKLPYAWILKLGSIWYRYKKHKDGIDILPTSIWNNTNYINNFDPITNNPNKSYTLDFNGQTGNTIQLESVVPTGISVQSGFYPKLINDFNIFYKGNALYKTYSDSEIQNTIDGGLKLYNFTQSNLNISQNSLPLIYKTWSVLLPSDDSTGYYFIPSFGGNQNQIVNSLTNSGVVVGSHTINGNPSVYNGSTRLFWASPNYGFFDVNQIKKPDAESYINNITGLGDDLSPFNLLNTNNYSKIEEIFSVFNKDILDLFEKEFIQFSSPVDNITVTSQSTTFNQSLGDSNVNFKNFQLLFRSLMFINSPKQNETNDSYFSSSISSQLNNFSLIIKNFLQYDVIFRYGNPSDYNRYIFDSFLQHNLSLTGVQTLNNKVTGNTLNNVFAQRFGAYTNGTLPPQTTLNSSKAAHSNEWKDLELYVGFSTIQQLTYKDSGSYITDFFIDNNIAFTSDNIKSLSTLIKMYATQKLKNPTITTNQFNIQINDYLTSCSKLQNDVLDTVLDKIRKGLPDYQEVQEKTIESQVSGQQSKVDIYENLKALNDKWIAGGDYKTNTFYEDILFLDRASRNIGDTIFLDIFTLKEVLNEKSINFTMSVHTFISGLLIRNNFTVMNLPAYVNFYNVRSIDGVPTPKADGSNEFADNMWGTFLNVDYRESGPKMVCFYVGKPSSYQDMDKSKNFLFRSDAFQLERNDNPLVENQSGKKDWALSNKCVGFNVDIGIRNQNVFNSFTVSQDNGKATAESIDTLLNMVNQATGRDTATQNVSLWNYYNNRSYGCQVVSLGNALIQPTMYFNLRHVPMFNGPYFITDVSHVISPGNFQTTFTGTRQAIFDFPALDSFLQSINRNLLTKIEQAITQKTEQTPSTSTDEISKSKYVQKNSDITKSEPNGCVGVVNPTYKTQGFVSIAATDTNINQKDFSDIIKQYTTDSNLQAIIFAICYTKTIKSNVFKAFGNNFALISLENDFSPFVFTSKNYSCVNVPVVGGSYSVPMVNFETPSQFILFMISRLQNNLGRITKEGLFTYYNCYWPKKSISVDELKKNITTSPYPDIRKNLEKGLRAAEANGINIDLTKLTIIMDGTG